ncbi:hypothetical protein EDB85DRAFT_105704 [Lactarius pseudohatsudake]|nr:hypothetical protein EDB85DRAFT_105704 [Lactarius pseudohatsudake]
MINDPDCDKTASGRLFSYKDGYDRLNGYEFVTVAQNWQLVKPQAWLEPPVVQVGDGSSTLTGETKDRTGHFLGWQLSLFPSTIDASIAREYEISLFDKVLPSLPSPNELPVGDHTSTTTKAHPKPTEASLEITARLRARQTNPHSRTGIPPRIPPSPLHHPAQPPAGRWCPPPTGSDISTLVANQRWVFGAAGIVLLFGLTAAVFLCRRAARRRRADDHSALPGDDLALGALPRGCRGPRTKELYDAFGEQGDDEDEPDEHTGLRARSPSATGVEVGFHEGFLDDEDPNTPRTALTPTYRDEPKKRHRHVGGAALGACIINAVAPLDFSCSDSY